MSGNFFLDWATLAVSLFNTILVAWLGLTVLLNAERRTWGVWVTGVGLLLGGVFFISHSAILGLNTAITGYGINFWWHVGWLPVVALPFSWYVVTLWYSGFWDRDQTVLRRRQRVWLVLLSLVSMGLLALLLFANPLPSFVQLLQFNFSGAFSVNGVSALLLIYPVYIVGCIGLSIDGLLHPEPSGRMMGDLARRRARPWLMMAAVVFLLVSLLVAWALAWIVLWAPRRLELGDFLGVAFTLSLFDGVIASLIAAAVILVGQAVVVYEVFTGRTLPRHGLRRQWRNTLILAAGYAAVVSWSQTISLRPIYSLLLTTVLVTVFLAFSAWRSYVERERYMRGLRPFVASQHLYPSLLQAAAPGYGAAPGAAAAVADVSAPFRALCEEVLGARRAGLVPLGALAPLVEPLFYPAANPPALPPLTELLPHLAAPAAISVPLDPVRYDGLLWAVPLSGERGLSGVLYLGAKRDDGLYSQEEIEIARASGERLMDTRASTELARRLMALQRQRLAESQVLDRRARRVLHDEVLPRLHTALLALSADPQAAEAVVQLTEAHREIAGLLREMPSAAAPEVTRHGLLGALRRAVDDEWAGAFEEVTWQVTPAAETQAAALPPLTAEVLFYAAREAVRNAAKYGRGAADPAVRLCLRVAADWQAGLTLSIEDNGAGWGPEGPRPESGGSGQGLALHSTLLAVVGGTLAVESVPRAYTRVILSLPASAWQGG